MSGLFQMDELSIKAEEAEQRADKAEFKVSLLMNSMQTCNCVT